MPDFSYLDSSGIGQIETPFQAPHTLETNATQFAPPPQVGPIPQGKGPIDFADLWKVGDTPKQVTPLFNDTLDINSLKGKVAPRSFDADRLIPYKQSGAFQDLGFNPQMPDDKQQAQYDYDQSNWEAAKSSISDLFHISTQAFTNYFKTYGSTVKSLINLNQDGIMYNDFIPQQQEDNERARANLRFKGDIPMHWYNYIPLPGLMKGDVAEELLPQLGFTVGTGAAAIIENLGVSLLTAGAGEPAEAVNTASKLYKLISDFTTLGRGAELAKNVYQGSVSGLRAGLDLWRLTNATLSETSLEAAQGFVQHKQKLIQDYIDKNGHAPAEGSDDMAAIDKSSHSTANDVMWGEFPVLFAGNWIQYRNLFVPSLAKKMAETEALRGFSIVNKAADKIASEFAVEGGDHGGFLHGALHFLKNATSEGLEEEGQNFVQNVSSDYEENKYQGKKNDVYDSILRSGVPDILSDNGLQQFMGGFVTGSVFHTLGEAGNRLALRGKIFDANGNLTGYKENLLTKLGFGTEGIAKANVKGYMQSVADILNTEDLKTAFKDEGLIDFVKNAQNGQALNEALQKNDLFNIGNLKSNALTRFLWTGMETGKLDLRMQQLEGFRGLSQDQLNEFLGINTGVSKENVDTMINYIQDKAQSVQQIFGAEKNRFSVNETKALNAFNHRLQEHQSLEQELRTKYNLPAEGSLMGHMIGMDEDARNEEWRNDFERLDDSNVTTNRAQVNYIATKEGRKAAVFAATSMDTDAERSRGIINDLGSRDLSYLGLRELLSIKSIDSKLKDLNSQIKAVQGVDNEQMLKLDDQRKALDKLRNAMSSYYGTLNTPNDPYWYEGRLSDIGKTKTASDALYNYMHFGEDLDGDQLRNKQQDQKDLTLLLQVERRNMDNLALYNRLTTSDKDFDTYTQHETKKTLQTIGKWTQEYLDNLSKSEPVSAPQAQTDDQKSIQEAVSEDTTTTPTEPPTLSPVDQKNEFIKGKIERGEPLTKEEEQFLSTASAVNDGVASTAKQYFAAKAEQTEPNPEPEPTQEVLHSTEDTKHSPTAGEFVPESNTNVKEDEAIETSRIQEHNGQVISDPNRTIVNELTPAEFAKPTPTLKGGYTAWKQGFFDFVGQNDLLDRYSAVLTLDSADNYPEGSAERAYLSKNAPGLILKIKDRTGNSTFDENYLPAKNGSTLVYSMPNSPAKTNLAGSLKVGEEIPVELRNLSQGIFDELANPRPTAELVDGISTEDYQFMIAQGPVDEKMFYDNGMALRNGGLYIKTKGSYIKLLPNYAGNLTINKATPDITSLVGMPHDTFEQAKNVVDFLQKVFYTNREKGGITFNVIRSGNQFVINASLMQNGRPVNLSAVEISGALKSQRINIDADSIGKEINFYHVVDGQVVSTKVDYNQFLKDNTLTNKKAYQTAEGKKVLRPVNRYLTLSSSLSDIYDNRKVETPSAKPEEKKEEPKITEEPKKSTRRKFDEGKKEEGFGDIDKLFKRKNGVQELTAPMQAEANWINSTFKQHDLATIKSVIDADAWGVWSRSGISLLENAPTGTGYHEAWHHFSQLYLTPAQRQAIYNEARSRSALLSKASDFHVEEALAEDFREYVLSKGQKILGNAPQRNTIFRRILDFLKRIFTGRKSLDRVYRDLYEGKLQRYQPSINNAQFGKLNSKLVDREGNELMNNQNSFRFLNHMESVAGQVLSQAGVSPTQFMTGDKDISVSRAKALMSQMRSALAKQANDLDEKITEFETKYPNESTPLLETWENISKVLDNFPSVFVQYYKQSAYRVGKFSIEDADSVADVDQQEASEASFGGKGWDVSGNEESVLDSASAETKALIKGLSKVQVDRDGNPVKVGGKVQLLQNEYGLYEPVPFVRTINNIANLLEGSFSYKEMLDKISDTSNQKRFPELALLAERLPDYTQPLKYPEVNQLSSFLKNFSKTYVPIYTLVRLDNGEFLFREETRKSQDLIERAWGNTFTTIPKDSPYVLNGTVQFDENDRPYINPQANLDFNLQTPNGRRDFLSFLGVQISQRAEGTRLYEDTVKPDKLGFLLQSLRTRLRSGQRIFNPIMDLKRSFTTQNGAQIMSEKTTVNALTNLEARFTDTNPSMSFRNAEGNMQHGLSENNWLTNNNYYLSRTQNYSQITQNPNVQHLNINNNPYIAHSLFLNKLFNLDPESTSYGQRRRVNGEPVTLTVANYNGMDTEVPGKNNEGAITTGLSPRDKLIMDMNALWIGGAVETMRPESAGSSWFVRLSDYAAQDGKVQDLPFTPEELGADPRTQKVLDYFNGAVQDEMSTIVNKFNSDLPAYKKNIGRFTMFDGILTDKTKNAIMDELKEARDDNKMEPSIKQALVDKVFNKYKTTIEKEVGDFLEGEVNDFYKLLREKDISMGDLSKTITQGSAGKRAFSLPEIATSFIVNDFVLNSEFAKLFDGNVGFFKAYHKRAKGNISTGTRAFTDDFLKAYLNSTKANTLAGSLGDTSDVNLNETKTVTFKDDIRKSVYTAERNSMYMRALRALNGNRDVEEDYKLMESKYNNMTVADGQGHATLDFYREMRMRVSNWSFADEVQYQKEVIGYREAKGLYKDDGQKERDQKFLQDYKGTSSTFPPIKMQYNGALKMPGVFAPVLDKFSVAPLIPSVIKGTVWDSVNDKLLKEGIAYTKFESGTKKYKFTPQQFYAEHDGYTAAIDNSASPYDSAIHTAEGLKEQLRTSSEPKDEATWGTQMRKLFLANLFSSGLSDEKFTSILNNYVDLLNKVEDQQKRMLYKEFGITEDNNGIHIGDMKNFVKTLQRQVDMRSLNDNIKNFLQYDENTGRTTYPLETSLNKSQIQDLISGMIFSRLTRLKVNGDMLIQVASSGFESPDFKYTNATEEDNVKYGSNGLPFYEPTFDDKGNVTGTKAMRVKVALIKEWTKLLNAQHMDGQKIGTLDRLNEALRDDKWRDENRRKTTMIGYRIPTQGANSMEFMEVHEFLPAVAGSIVILPAEIVAKAGSDYDIDKMPIIRPSLTDDGHMADEAPEFYEKQLEGIRSQLEGLFKKEKEINSTRRDHDYSASDRLLDKIAYGYDAEDIEQEIDGLILDNDKIQELIGKYMRVASNRQGSLTNKMIDIYKNVLSSPEMFKQLIMPNNVDLVKPIAQEIAKLTGLAGFDKQGNTVEFTNTDILKYRSNLVKFEQLLSGKRDVGIFAKANTMSQLLQQAGMNVNQDYTTFETIKGNIVAFKRSYNPLLLSPEERENLKTTKVGKDGETQELLDYSTNVDANNVYKQDTFSQLINGTVDVASDPWYMGLRLNDKVKGALVHMINQGIPVRRAVLFLNHPAVQNYTNALILQGNIEKWNIISQMLGTGPRGKKMKLLNRIEAIDASGLKAREGGFYFNEKELASHIADPSKSNDWYNRQVLAHFLKLDEQGGLLRDLGSISSFDTTKYLTPISAQNNLDLRLKVKDSDLFDQDAVQKILTHSMISPFNNLSKTIDIFSKLMPVGMSKGIVEASADLMRQFSGDKGQRIRLERTLNNDWIEFIIKNYGRVQGMNFENYAKDLLVFNGGNEVLAQKLTELKNLAPELNYFDAFKRLYNNTSERSKGWRNIELQRTLDNSADYQNVLIEELTQLSNFQGNEIPGAKFDPAQVSEIRNFFTKLGYLAFMQSGFNKSRLYFTDVVPSDNLVPIFRQALSTYEQALHLNPQAEQEIISAFIAKFKQQNPTFGFEGAIARETWRGKLYKVVDDQDTKALPNPEPDDYMPPTDVFELPKSIPTNEKTYTNHSGGAEGADMAWDKIGREFGVENHNHYRPSDLAGLNTEDRSQLEKDVTNAAKGLGRPTSEFRGKDLVRRNWLQVRGADSIYAVSRIVNPGEMDKGFQNTSGKQVVGGGTGWAVEMAIQKGKPVFVFDTKTKDWYTWDLWQNKFVPSSTPILTYNFAGIGSREMTPEGLQAIRDVYKLTLATPTPFTLPYRVQLQAWNYGDLMGKPNSKENRATINDHVINRPDTRLPGGESFNQARNRAIDEFRELLQTMPDGALIITHSTVLRMFHLWDESGRPIDNSFDYNRYINEQTTTGEVMKFKSTNGTLYVARHGQTTDNANGIMRSNNSTLNQNGIDQAIRIAEQFKDKVPPVVLSSPLTRAMQTHQIVANILGLNNVSDEDIDEGLNNCNI